MTARFTPGPWHVGVAVWNGGSDSTESIWTANADCVIDRSDDPFCGDDVERDANVHLVAAAPDLYQMLRDADRAIRHLPMHEDECGSCDRIAHLTHEIARALTKAEGSLEPAGPSK